MPDPKDHYRIGERLDPLGRRVLLHNEPLHWCWLVPLTEEFNDACKDRLFGDMNGYCFGGRPRDAQRAAEAAFAIMLARRGQ